MKYVSMFALAVSLATVAACGSSDSPNAPSGDKTVTFTAALRPDNEVPAVTGPEAAGSGTATITMTVSTDQSGNVSAATANFAVNLAGFPNGTPINMSHIHQASAGQGGNVVVNTNLSPGELSLNNGSGSFTKNGIAVSAVLAQQLMTNPAGFYFNVHSTDNPNGVARGQLVRTQ